MIGGVALHIQTAAVCRGDKRRVINRITVFSVGHGGRQNDCHFLARVELRDGCYKLISSVSLRVDTVSDACSAVDRHRLILTLAHLGNAVDFQLSVKQILNDNAANRNILVGICDNKAVINGAAVCRACAMLGVLARLGERCLVNHRVRIMQCQARDGSTAVRLTADKRLYNRLVVGYQIIFFARIRRMHVHIEGQRSP